ncbi:hypothetical protein ACOMHN_053911 [Nucella lapillus]
MALLLGVPDRQVDENENTSWEINKIGGTSDWFHENTKLPCCGRCQREMTLVTQVYCPLTNSPFHRCLHIFLCPSKPCSMQTDGWRVVRTQLLDEKSAQPSKATSAENDWTMDQDDWGVGQDDWGDGGDDDDDDDGGGGGLSQETQEKDLSQLQEAAADKLSAMTISTDLHPPYTANLDPFMQPKSINEGFSSPALDKDSPDRCGDGDGGGGALEEKTFADFTNSEAKTLTDSEGSHGDGGASWDQVEAEATSVDDEGLQRMVGLLAAGEDCGKARESVHQGAGEARKEAFPAYYLDVFGEGEVEDAMTHHVTSLLEDYRRREAQDWAALLKDAKTGQSTASGADAEKYDKTEVKHGDRQCYRFIKKLQACPQQCVRYQWKGSPLLISKSSQPLTVSKCERCQAPRVFELQLVPPLIPFLTFPGQTEPQVEFGTVLVFTCRDSCWTEGQVYREEMCLLQHDPDQHLFK